MKLTGREFLSTLNDYFSQANYEVEITLLFLLPVVTSFVLLVYLNNRRPAASPFARLSRQDLEFIDTARLQKGLEEFDRDFLLELAFAYKIKPGYLFIDPDLFNQLEKRLHQELTQKGEVPEKNKRFQHVLKIKRKLF